MSRQKSIPLSTLHSAVYDIAHLTGEFVFIIDCDVDGKKSVTNDADRVTAEVAAAYDNRRIIYRDSSGDWDELVHDHGRFTGFKPTPSRTAEYGGLA